MLKEQGVQGGTKAVDAVTWLQKSFALADQLDDPAAPGTAELRVRVRIGFPPNSTMCQFTHHLLIRYRYCGHSVRVHCE